jgi:site-specific DNA-methyltransferase (adenine-specific)
MTYPMLLNGDCLELMKTLPAKSIDLFICDLPYGCLSSNKTQTECSWDIKIDLDKFWEQVERLMKDDHTPIIHFCSAKFGYDLIKSKESWFRYDLVWEKTNAVGFLTANKMPMRAHELIYVFAKKGTKYYRKDLVGDYPSGGGGTSSATFLPIAGMPNLGTTEAGRRCVKSVITIANKKTKGGHPTQKPVEIYKWLLERYSKEGDVVLDPTAGSFTSVSTTTEMNRKAIGIEMNKEFFEKAQNNIWGKK